MPFKITYNQSREEKSSHEKAIGQRYFILDGVLITIFGTLVGGIFLIGYALNAFDAQPYHIGLLAALPSLASPVYLLSSYLLQRTKRRKPIVIFARLGIRFLWSLAALLPMAIFRPLGSTRLWMLVAINGTVSFFGAFHEVAFISWISDVVPEDIRGRYFGKREAICGAAGMVASFIGGKFIDLWKSNYGEKSPYGFVILFGIGIFFGLLSLIVLSKTPEPEFKRSEPRGGFRQLVKEALRDRNFTKLIFFYVAWTFACGIAGPFYAVFMIKNLSLSFSFIAFLGILTSIIYLLTLRPWGIISDRFGNRPIMLVTGVAIGIIPFLWLLATPKNYSILLLLHLIGGFVGAGANLTHFNIKLKLTPEENRPVYLALSVVPCGIAGFISTSAGGYIARALQNLHFKFLFLSFCNYNILFILSGLFLLTSLFLLQKVHEPKAVSAPQMVTIIRETKELNPIYSLGWAIDYTAFSLRQSRTILHRLDRESEELSARSENFIARLIYRAEKWLRRKIHFPSNTKKGG